MRVEVLVWIKDKIRGRYLGRHMDHLADSIAKLSQGRENWYVGREGIPVDDSFGEKCEPVIVFECMDLSVGQRVNVSGLSYVGDYFSQVKIFFYLLLRQSISDHYLGN